MQPLNAETILKAIDELFQFEAITHQELFNLRVLLDERDPVTNLKQDINDLAQFPERLVTSYQPEWQLYCRKRLLKLCQEKSFTEQREAKNYLIGLRDAAAEHAKQHENLAAQVSATLAMLNSDKVVLLESEASKRIRKLIG